MAEPTLIRARAAGDKATVRLLMSHPMETGLRKDAQGKLVPAWHIQQVTAEWNGQTVLRVQWGTSVSKNPFLQFSIRGAKAGDLVRVSWVDNRGESRSDQATIA
jgi:sulfur-oxidizing protein SoxZ